MNQRHNHRHVADNDRYSDGHIAFEYDRLTDRVRITGEGPASAFQALMGQVHEPRLAPPDFEMPSVPRQFGAAIAHPPDDRLDRIEAAIIALSQQPQQRQHQQLLLPQQAAEGSAIVRYEPRNFEPERLSPATPIKNVGTPSSEVGNMGIPLYDALFTSFVRNVLGIRHETGTFAVTFGLFLVAIVLGVKVGLPMARNLISVSTGGQELLAKNKAPP